MKHKEYTIRYGDTLQSIAGTFYNDAGRWMEIATYNGLEFPYIAEKAGRNVRTIGETLLIPLDADVEQGISTESWLDDFIGEDLELKQDFRSDIYGDLATVTGLQNLAQALDHRFMTERGELLYHPEYGSNLHQLVGRREPFILEMIELEIIETAYQDPRVDHIEIRTIEREGRKVFVECLITIVGQEAPHLVPFNLTVGGR